MRELIERLRYLVESIEGESGSNIDTRGCHDVLLAMEERLDTIRARLSQAPSPAFMALLERA